MTGPIGARIAEALRQIINPRTGQDVISGDMIRDLTVSDDGRARLSILLAAQDPASLVRDVRRAAEGVDGVREVRVDVKTPLQGDVPRAAKPPGAARALPVLEPAGQRAPPPRPAPTPVAYPHLGRILAVSSGKGGVGKSTVATNLAVALARSGARVGLMDADIYGPNIPRMMGVHEQPPVEHDRIQPLVAHGVKLISLGFLVEPDQPAIWRGPIVMKIITQFLQDVDWGELDYFIVDLPPGTGDAQLSLVQATHVAGAVIVTTPQAVAVGDALRGAKMFERVGVPVLGIIENMSYLLCQHCGKPTPLFGAGGGTRLAGSLGLPLLGQIPIAPEVGVGGDTGEPVVVLAPESPAAKALVATTSRVADALGVLVSA